MFRPPVATRESAQGLKLAGERLVERGSLSSGIATFQQAQQRALATGDWDVYSESIYAESDALTLAYQVQSAKNASVKVKKPVRMPVRRRQLP